MRAEDTLMSDVIIHERAKNIVGAPWGSVVQNLIWLVDKQAEITWRKAEEHFRKQALTIGKH